MVDPWSKINPLLFSELPRIKFYRFTPVVIVLALVLLATRLLVVLF